jgi:predicted DNA-binding protein (MmcQ/YjbR family)
MNIEILQSICNKLPAVTEDIKWGNDLCFCLAGKIFCVAGLTPPLRISFKVTNDEFDELTSIPGIIPAPYMARNKWILVEDLSVLNKEQWEKYIFQSYELVKAKLPKKLLRSLWGD